MMGGGTSTVSDVGRDSARLQEPRPVKVGVLAREVISHFMSDTLDTRDVATVEVGVNLDLVVLDDAGDCFEVLLVHVYRLQHTSDTKL